MRDPLQPANDEWGVFAAVPASDMVPLEVGMYDMSLTMYVCMYVCMYVSECIGDVVCVGCISISSLGARSHRRTSERRGTLIHEKLVSFHFLKLNY